MAREKSSKHNDQFMIINLKDLARQSYSIALISSPCPSLPPQTPIFGNMIIPLFKIPKPLPLIFFFKANTFTRAVDKTQFKDKIINNSRTVTAEHCAKCGSLPDMGSMWLSGCWSINHLIGKEVRPCSVTGVGGAGPICSFVFHKLEHSSISLNPVKHIYR